MNFDEPVRIVAEKVLKELIEYYHADAPYYWKPNIVKHMMDNDENVNDSFFINDELVIEYIKHILSDNYELAVTPAERVFKFDDSNKEDFTYIDTELKIIKKIKC